MSSCPLYTSSNYMYYTINGEIEKCPIQTVICYIELSFKAGLPVNEIVQLRKVITGIKYEKVIH